MRLLRLVTTVSLVALLSSLAPSPARADSVRLLHVSYDVTRELFADYNPAFAAFWKAKTGDEVSVQMSHGGSSKQARSVIDGLEADVVSMNQAIDLDAIADKGRLLPREWATLFPDRAAPFTSTILFVVRRGNPKQIHDWPDLVRPGVSVVIPNPKTSGNGRYSYMAAWAYALRKPGGNEQEARGFVGQLFARVPVLDTGGRGSTTTFAQRGIGDVLLTFENEAALALRELGPENLEVVVPPTSILAEPPVAVVTKVAAKHGTTEVARAYLEHLWSGEGQEIAARHDLRPRDAAVLARYADRFPKLVLYTVDDVFGGFARAQATHFADGGMFDQIYGVR